MVLFGIAEETPALHVIYSCVGEELCSILASRMSWCIFCASVLAFGRGGGVGQNGYELFPAKTEHIVIFLLNMFL